MNRSLLRATALLACATTVAALPAFADSAVSSASSAGSASIGSLSDSSRGSSRSSNRRNDVAEGDWRVVEVAELAERPGVLRVRLQPPAPAPAGGVDALEVDVPQRTLAPRPLAAGDLVRVRHRPYGVELARVAEPFFLLLDDDWRRELDPRRVL
jgi:hypothetical protein